MSNLTDFVGTSGSGGGPLAEVIHNGAYTFAVGDEISKLHKSTDATPYTWTIPLNATVNFAKGSVITLFNAGAGDITITADGAAILTDVGSTVDGDRAVQENSLATLVQVDTDEWVMSGGGPAASGQAVTPTQAKLYFLRGLQ